MPPTTSISFEQLSKYFHLPINDVAKELGICATMLKKICRRNGIPRWPHRKIKSLNKMIENLEASLQNNTSEAEDCIKQEISILKNKKTLIMKNPSVLAGGSTKRLASQSLEIDKPTVKKVKHDDGEPLMMTKINGPASMHTPNPSSSLSINQLLTSSSSFTPLTSYLDPEENEGGHPHSSKSAQYAAGADGAAHAHAQAHGVGGVNGTHWAPAHNGAYGYPHSEYHYKYNPASYQMAHHPPSPPSAEYGSGRGSNHLMYSMAPPHAAGGGYSSGSHNSQVQDYTLPKMNLPPYSQQAAGKYSPPQQSASQGNHGGSNSSGGSDTSSSSASVSYQQSNQDSSYPQYKPASHLRFTHHPSQYQQQQSSQSAQQSSSQQQLSPHQQQQGQNQPMVLRWVMEYDKLKK